VTRPRADRERLELLVHEVRSPTAALAAISAALAESELDDDSLVDLIGLALAACAGIERVVIDASPSSLNLEDVDAAEVVRAAVSGAMLGGSRVRAVLGSSALVVRGDPVRLRQAVDNLVVNALTHSPLESDVAVGASGDETTVRIWVHDAGHGIAPEQHARIFEPGVRLDSSVPGSGLGLAVARSIAEAHGGTLAVQSSPGEGATFTIALPRRSSG
jgi:signal transduction histidine kinase